MMKVNRAKPFKGLYIFFCAIHMDKDDKEFELLERKSVNNSY